MQKKCSIFSYLPFSPNFFPCFNLINCFPSHKLFTVCSTNYEIFWGLGEKMRTLSVHLSAEFVTVFPALFTRFDTIFRPQSTSELLGSSYDMNVLVLFTKRQKILGAPNLSFSIEAKRGHWERFFVEICP